MIFSDVAVVTPNYSYWWLKLPYSWENVISCSLHFYKYISWWISCHTLMKNLWRDQPCRTVKLKCQFSNSFTMMTVFIRMLYLTSFWSCQLFRYQSSHYRPLAPSLYRCITLTSIMHKPKTCMRRYIQDKTASLTLMVVVTYLMPVNGWLKNFPHHQSSGYLLRTPHMHKTGLTYPEPW